MSVLFFLFKQKTAYEMRISDWSSDVCSSDLRSGHRGWQRQPEGISIALGISPRARRSRRSDGSATRVLDRKRVVWGKSVPVRVDLGGRRILKKKTSHNNTTKIGCAVKNKTTRKKVKTHRWST